MGCCKSSYDVLKNDKTKHIKTHKGNVLLMFERRDNLIKCFVMDGYYNNKSYSFKPNYVNGYLVRNFAEFRKTNIEKDGKIKYVLDDIVNQYHSNVMDPQRTRIAQLTSCNKGDTILKILINDYFFI